MNRILLKTNRESGNKLSLFALNTKRYLLPLLLATACILPSLVNADAKQDAQYAALFEQAFGKKNNKKASKSGGVSLSSSQTLSIDTGQTKPDKKQQSKEDAPAGTQQSHDLADLYARAFGNKARQATPSNIPVELRVNKNVIGEITLFSNQQGVIDYAKTSETLELLKDVIKEHIFKRIQQKISSKDRVSFKTLTMLGMKATYNSVNLSLDLQINPELRKPRVLSMKAKRKAGVIDENKITAEEISGFLNLYANLGLDKGNSENIDTRIKLEGSINVKGVVLETEGNYINERIEVGRTSLTYDRPDNLQRLIIGDFSTGNRNFQENLELTGIKISKEFFMDPELQIRPQGSQYFTLDTESEVEVYINSQLHQRYYLKQGIYSLQDIGLYDGINNIRLRIKDAFGKITEKTSQHFYDSHLLNPDVSLYSFAVGYLDSNNSGNSLNQSLEDKAIFSGYFQKGINKNLTISLDAQLSEDAYLLGSEAITSNRLGSFKNSFALSGGREKEDGYATLIEFKPNIGRQLIGLDTLTEDMLELDKSIGSFLRGWTFTGEFRSRHFSMLKQYDKEIEQADKLRARLSTHFGFDINKDWFGSAHIGVAQYYDDEETHLQANIAANKRFNNGVRLSVGARYDKIDDFSMNLQLTVPLDRYRNRHRKSWDILANTKNNSLETKLSLRPTSKVGRGSLEGTLEYIQNDTSKGQKLDLRYRSTSLESYFNARNATGIGENKTDSGRVNIGFNTSFACVGSQCGVSYPIDDSFALVSGPSNQKDPIAINTGGNRFRYSDGNNTGLPDNYTALIPANGKKAVVPLDSYRYQNINIDAGTLPNGYDPEKIEFEVFPKYRQGFVIKAGGEPATILDGTLVDHAKKPLGFKGGQWVPVSGEGKTIAFFSNKAGRFRVSSIPAGRYKLELFDYPYMNPISINVPELPGEIHDVGNLLVHE